MTGLEIKGAIVALGLVAFLIWMGFHDASIKSKATAQATVGIQIAQAAASAATAIRDVKVEASQKENLHEATAQNAARVADARALAAVVHGLHDDAIRPVAAARGASAAGGSEAGGDPGAELVPRRLLDGADAALADTASDAADLAVYVRGLRTSGSLCVNDYEALKP